MTNVQDVGAFDLASILWRDGRIGGWDDADRQAPVRSRFVAVPNATEPRQLLPWRWSSIVASGRRRSDDRPRSKQLRDMVGVAALLGLGAVSDKRRLAVTASGSLVAHVATELGHEGALGIVMCGPPRANEKPVIQLHDRRGRTIAYVKVAWNDLTRRLVADEGQALRRLAELSVPFTVPRIVATGTHGETSWLAISPVQVADRCSPTIDRIDRLAHAIEATGETATATAADSGFVDSLRSSTASLPRSGPVIAQLARRDAELPIGHGAAHGDFVPWNILSGSPDTAVWDWERYRTSTPLGYDRLHYRVQVALHRKSTSIRDTIVAVDREIDTTLADIPIDRRERHLHWYLADIMARYERDLIENDSPLLPELVDGIHSFLRERITPDDT
jgi:hypothetical protein